MDAEQHQAQHCNESDEGEDNHTNACSVGEAWGRNALYPVVYAICDQGRANAKKRCEESYTQVQCEGVHQRVLLLSSFS
jgi:hypothetical protein